MNGWNEFDDSGPIGSGVGLIVLGVLLSIWHWNLWYLIGIVVGLIVWHTVSDWLDRMRWKAYCDREERAEIERVSGRKMKPGESLYKRPGD